MLRALCEVTGEEMRDRRFPIRVRLDCIGHRMEETPQAEHFDEFFDGIKRSEERNGKRPGITYRQVTEAAAAQGVPNWRCPALQQALDAHNAGRDDVDRSRVSSFEQDLKRLCDIVTAHSEDASDADEGSGSRELFRRIDREISNPELRELLENIGTYGSVPIEAFREAVAAQGVRDWHCPAIEDWLNPS